METKTSLIRRKDVIWREVDGEVVIISSDSKRMHVLNETASMIWLLLDGIHDQDSIGVAVAAEFGESVETVKKDMDDCIDQFRALALLEE
jgi:hypothetical protein